MAGLAAGVVLAWASWAAADSPAAPTTQPETRPRVAVAGIESAADGDSRDAWLATALEELLSRRLRRVSQLVAVPTVRLYQARRELQAAGEAPPDWPAVARGLGAAWLLSGRCAGPADEVGLELILHRLDESGLPPASVSLPAGRVFDVLDAATRWVLEQLGVGTLEGAAAEQVFARPSESVSAVEYHARAAVAARAERFQEAVRFASQSLAMDRGYRPALGLLAQAEMKLGREGRGSAAVDLQLLLRLARKENDGIDRANAELASSVLAQADGSSEAALIRAQTALALAGEQRDVFGEIAALTWLTDLYLMWRLPAQEASTPEQQKAAQRANLERAAENQRVLLERLARVGDSIGALPATNKLALICERLEQYDAAYELHQRTLELARTMKSRAHEATAWLFLGQWYRGRERWNEAVEALERCLALADESGKPAVRTALAGVYAGMGAHDRALEQLEQAYAALRKTNDLMSQYSCVREIAGARLQLGRRPEAIAALQEALELAHALELRDEVALKAQLEEWQKGGP